MANPHAKSIILFLASLLLLSACSPLTSTAQGPSIPGLAQTLAAQTLTAQQGSWPANESPTPSLLPTIDLLTSNILPESTPVPIVVPDPLLTPFTNGQNSESAIQSPENCVNAAEFIKDISIPDNTVLNGGQRFIKTWQFKNVGTCTWTPDYAVVFVWGAKMSANSPKFIGRAIAPGHFVEVSTELRAPKEPGQYSASWIFQDADGHQFGTGYEAKQPFWIVIAILKSGGALLGGSGPCLGKG
jgi:hypothetical protein